MWGAGQARPHRHSPAGEPPAPEAPSGAARGLKGRGEWGTGCTDRGVFSKWEESRGGLGQRAIGVFGDGIRAGVWVGGCGVNALGVCGHSAAQGGGGYLPSSCSTSSRGRSARRAARRPPQPPTASAPALQAQPAGLLPHCHQHPGGGKWGSLGTHIPALCAPSAPAAKGKQSQSCSVPILTPSLL